MRVGLEIGINEVRNLARLAVQLDQVGSVDFAEVGSGASLIDAQERIKRVERRAMDVECMGSSLPTADRRQALSMVWALPARKSRSSARRHAFE